MGCEAQTVGPASYLARTRHTRAAGCESIQWEYVRTLEYSAFSWGE